MRLLLTQTPLMPWGKERPHYWYVGVNTLTLHKASSDTISACSGDVPLLLLSVSGCPGSMSSLLTMVEGGLVAKVLVSKEPCLVPFWWGIWGISSQLGDGESLGPHFDGQCGNRATNFSMMFSWGEVIFIIFCLPKLCFPCPLSKENRLQLLLLCYCCCCFRVFVCLFLSIPDSIPGFLASSISSLGYMRQTENLGTHRHLNNYLGSKLPRYTICLFTFQGFFYFVYLYPYIVCPNVSSHVI